ncbi:UNVERIFIED_CONTAM: hypothetical protein Sangu_0056600 [Sesamum angustifolium]|uniref:SWIM-type domain-containing protein n=1 Tax=Sesamum angustifolium TaxID=2727405 RepID=A0AAW2RKC2_9LAMI
MGRFKREKGEGMERESAGGNAQPNKWASGICFVQANEMGEVREGSLRKEAVMPIKKDRDLQYFFNPMTGYVSIDIFVQAEKIREMVVPDDPAVSEWGTYMSMLTQELSSVPVVTQSMGRFGINDDYPGPSSYASPSDYAGPSSFAVHQIMQVHLHLQDHQIMQDLCWRAGAEVNARKFERIMTEIRELNEEAYNWLEMIDKTQWTLSHDSGWRTGILTTNMSECVNGVLKGARRLPIVAIVQITFHRSVRYFLERTTRCHRMLNANQEWADFAFRIFEARQAEAVHHIVQKFDYNQQSASVLTLSLTGQGSHTYVVKLKHKTCSCGKWGTHGIPCSHAIQVSRHFGVNASNFIPQYYSIRAYRKTYQGRFEPLYGEEYWDPVDIELVHNPAVRVRRGPGRYVSTRIPNEMDRPQARARQQYQSRQV